MFAEQARFYQAKTSYSFGFNAESTIQVGTHIVSQRHVIMVTERVTLVSASLDVSGAQFQVST